MKQVLLDIRENLLSSVVTGWNEGYLNDFVRWSDRMSKAIKDAGALLLTCEKEFAKLENEILELKKTINVKDELIAKLINKNDL